MLVGNDNVESNLRCLREATSSFKSGAILTGGFDVKDPLRGCESSVDDKIRDELKEQPFKRDWIETFDSLSGELNIYRGYPDYGSRDELPEQLISWVEVYTKQQVTSGAWEDR